MTKNAVTLSANASLLLTPIVTKFITDKFCNGDTSKVECLADASKEMNNYISSENVDLSSYKYIMKKYDINSSYYELNLYATNCGYVKIDDSGFSFWQNNNSIHLFIRRAINSVDSKRYDFSKNYGLSSTNAWSRDKNAFASYYSWNGPMFNSSDDAKAYENGDYSRVDWVTPELQDTFDNKGNLELLPSFDPLASYSMASQQALQELLSNLASSSLAPAQQLDLVNKFIASLKTSETPDPSPNPDPSPEPNPNPDPSNPDSGDGDNSGDSDIDKGSFVRDLRTLFPFCIPFDLIDCIRLFNAEPVTPKIEVPMHFAFVDVDYTWTIDLKDFNGVATVCRSMFLILFIVGLVLITRNLIRG